MKTFKRSFAGVPHQNQATSLRLPQVPSLRLNTGYAYGFRSARPKQARHPDLTDSTTYAKAVTPVKKTQSAPHCQCKDARLVKLFAEDKKRASFPEGIKKGSTP